MVDLLITDWVQRVESILKLSYALQQSNLLISLTRFGFCPHFRIGDKIARNAEQVWIRISVVTNKLVKLSYPEITGDENADYRWWHLLSRSSFLYSFLFAPGWFQKKSGLNIVNRGEWLWNPTKFFLVCFCSIFWPWPCTKHNCCLLLTEEQTNRNVLVT